MSARRATPSRRRRFVGVAVALMVTVLLGTSCDPVFGGTDDTVHFGVLTSPTGLQYDFSTQGASVTATAPMPVGDGNLREVFWTDDADWYPDQEYCSTWNDVATATSGMVQPGIALRIAPAGENGEGIKAVTVTQNVVFGAVWIFNVHVWNSTIPGGQFTLVDQFDLSPLIGKIWRNTDGSVGSNLADPPWHVCAFTMDDQFSFKIWTGSETEPSWSDASRVHTTTLPPGWDHPGYAGGYIGHLLDGSSATFTDMTSGPTCLDPDLLETSHCQELLGPTSTTLDPEPTSPPTTSSLPGGDGTG